MARHRSPNYPMMSLEAAIKDIKKINDVAGLKHMTGLEILNVLGYKSLSGASRSRFSALKKFDLVEGDYDQAKISELGIRILFPEDDESKLSDLRIAALQPELFSRVFEKFGSDLPSEGVLKNWLVRELKFNQQKVSKFIESLQSTFEFAKIGSEDDSNLETDESAPPVEDSHDSIRYESEQKEQKQSEQSKNNTMSLFATWPIGPGIHAQLSFTNEHEVTVDDLEAVCDYIEVAKKQLGRTRTSTQKNASEAQTDEADGAIPFS